MDTIKRGSLFPQSQKVIIRYDPQSGIVIDNDWKGAGQPEMLALFQDYVASGIACQISYQNDIADLQSSDSTQQTTLDTWEVVGNEESVDGLSHPTVTQIASADQVAAMRAGLENITTALTTTVGIITILNKPVFDGISDGDKFVLLDFMDLQVRGSTEYRKASYCVRHTTNAPSRNLPNIADVGVNNIYTVAQFLTEVQSSALWLFPMPANLVYQIANIPTPLPKTGYLWGWLKSPPVKATAANNRINIVTEYVLEQWSVNYYAPY